MTKITINAVTHKDAVLWNASEEDALIYDEVAAKYFAALEKAATEEGFEFSIEPGTGTKSYRVDGRDYDQVKEAHDLVQGFREFWDFA